jgi:hypothetical protein
VSCCFTLTEQFYFLAISWREQAIFQQGWSLGCQSDDEPLNNKMQTSTYHVSKSSPNYFNLYLCYIYIYFAYFYI